MTILLSRKVRSCGVVAGAPSTWMDVGNKAIVSHGWIWFQSKLRKLMHFPETRLSGPPHMEMSDKHTILIMRVKRSPGVIASLRGFKNNKTLKGGTQTK